MAGSDLNVAFTSNTSGTQELFGGSTRLKGFIITPTANAGNVVFADGGTNKFTVATAASAASGPVSIGLPDEGVKFTTNLQATLTNVAGLTTFHA